MKLLTIVLGILMFVPSGTLAAQEDCETPDGLQPLAVYSLFYSNYRNNDFEFALKYGRWMVDCEVREIEGNKRYSLVRHYERMIKAYEEIAKTKDDPSIREAYVDTALSLFDRGFEIFSAEEVDVYDWKLDKGRFLQNNADYIEDGASSSYAIYAELFEDDPKRTTELGDGYYVQIILQDKNASGDKQGVLTIIDQATPYANDALNGFMNDLKIDQFDSPEEQIGYWEDELAKDPTNVSVLKTLAKLYDDVDDRDKGIEISTKLYEVEPTPENAEGLGDIAKSNANYSDASKYFQEAYEGYTENADKERLALEVSSVLLSTEDLRQARTWARRALEFNANSGAAYIAIANIYGQSVSQCTEERKLERKDRVVYWLVLDYLDRAKSVDSSVSSQVSRLVQTYQPVTPTQEDKFFEGWNAGDKMVVDSSLFPCYEWVSETTTVR